MKSFESLKSFFITALLVSQKGGLKRAWIEPTSVCVAAFVVFIGLSFLLTGSISFKEIWIPLVLIMDVFLTWVIIAIVRRRDVLKKAREILKQ